MRLVDHGIRWIIPTGTQGPRAQPLGVSSTGATLSWSGNITTAGGFTSVQMNWYAPSYAWWEIFPEHPDQQIVSGLGVVPGDEIYADVSNNGSGGADFHMINDTLGEEVYFAEPLVGSTSGQSEWITERPADDSSGACSLPPLADLGTEVLGSAKAYAGAWQSLGNLAHAYDDIDNSSSYNTLLAYPSDLLDSGTAFPNIWVQSGSRVSVPCS
ncbi:MAG: G1 family glutamic endopeptidase [Actinomycetes bacterium]